MTTFIQWYDANGDFVGVKDLAGKWVSRGGVPMPDSANVTFLKRRLRSLLSLIADLNALSASKKNAIWTDISSGSPPKWSTDTGPNAAAIAVLQLLATSGLSAADVLTAKVRGVAMYVQDNPKYLVNPSFDTSINVPGDEVIP